jgi:hypothetical protein
VKSADAQPSTAAHSVAVSRPKARKPLHINNVLARAAMEVRDAREAARDCGDFDHASFGAMVLEARELTRRGDVDSAESRVDRWKAAELRKVAPTRYRPKVIVG